MSDLERFEQFFKDLDIKYTVSKNQISIHENHIIEDKYSYGKALDIAFSDEGKFLGFEPWGE
jgi:hypothetical protein